MDRYLSVLDTEEEMEIRCPVCNFESVHPVGVKVEPVNGDTLVYINYDGLITMPSEAAKRVRGIQTTLTYICESGHQWDELRSFHKGNTLLTIQRGPDWDDAECTPTTIWRD